MSMQLTDNFGRRIDYLRLSVTDRCDLRCQYCMPKDFKGFAEPGGWLSYEEITRVISAFARLGLSHLRLTGGEPLVRRDLPVLVRQLAAIPGIEDVLPRSPVVASWTRCCVVSPPPTMPGSVRSRSTPWRWPASTMMNSTS